MSLIGKLWRDVWHKQSAMDRPHELTRQVIDHANSGMIDEALALARHAPDLRWEDIAAALPESSLNAEALLCLCLHRSVNRFPALLALGRWLAANGQSLRAYQCAQEAHRLMPTEPSPLVLMGWLQLGLGNPRAAGDRFLAAISRDESDMEAMNGYRLAWQQTKGLLPAPLDAKDDKTATYLDAIAANPGDPSCYLALGKHLATSSRCALALPYLRTAHELAPREAEPAYWLARSVAALGDYQAALDIATATLKDCKPEHRDMKKLAAECASRLGNDKQATDWLASLIDGGEADASVYNNLGQHLNQVERYAEAADTLALAVALDPALTEARHNYAHSLYCLGSYDLALEQLDALLQFDRNDFSARWYRASCLLADQQFREGWRDYEFRFASTAVDGRVIPLPAWRGEELADKKIVVTAEQGIGDEIMFASCLPQLIARAGQCVIECNVRLVDLFRRSFPQATIVEMTNTPTPLWMTQHGDADFHVFSGSLPQHFLQTLADFENRQPYLLAAQDKALRLRQRLAALGPGLKVGIAWQGGRNTSRTRTRSLRLDQLQPVFDTPGCIFVSIQYGDHSEEVAAFDRQTGISLHHWPEAIADLDAFAALVSALDIIVTVCSAPVHFAGALGKTALVLTPHAPEWRYRGIDGRMVWYPSVRLFPQACLDDWGSAIQIVANIVRQESCDHVPD